MPLPLYGKTKEKAPLNPLDRIKNILVIAAGKGGVGKSTVTVQLAFALQEMGYKVGVMDIDIYGPSIRKMLPEDQKPSQNKDVIYPAICKGIQMISMAYFRKENEAAAVRAPIANAILKNFINHVQWAELDYLLVDFPPGTGDIPLTFVQQVAVTGALMITTPQEVSILDVQKAMALFEEMQVPILGVVENMSYYQTSLAQTPLLIFGQGGGQKLADHTQKALLQQIPLDPLLCYCSDKGYSLFEEDVHTTHPVTQAFRQLAQTVVSKKPFNLAEDAPILQMQKMWQPDRHHLSILWNDQVEKIYRLSDVQKNCLCAACANVKSSTFNTDVEAKNIQIIGRYGVQIEFTSGCSYGIYSFQQLREMNLDK